MTDQLTEALWHRGELSYKLHPGQKEVYNIVRASENEDVTLLISRRWGKSFLMATFACEEAIRIPNSRIILLAPNKAQAYDIYTPIIKRIAEDAPKGFVRPTKSESKWHVGTSELIFAGFDTIAESLRGGGAIAVIFDEVAFVNPDEYEYVTKSIIFPLLQKTIGKRKGRKLWSSTPAKTPEHPFNLHWEAVEKEGKLHRYTIYDNPILTPEDIQAAIDEQGGVDSVGFRREYMCENVRDTGGLIIPKFEARHILDINKIPGYHHQKWMITDVGGIRDKCVIQVWGRLITDGKCVIIDECKLEANTDILEVGQNIILFKKKYQIEDYHIWVDGHGQTLVDLHKLCGIAAPLPPKQDRDSAISALNAAFYRDEVYIASNCQFTTVSLKNCMFNEKRTDFLRSEAYGHADAIMATVYGYRVAHLVALPRMHSGGSNQNQFNRTISSGIYSEISKKLNTIQNIWRK